MASNELTVTLPKSLSAVIALLVFSLPAHGQTPLTPPGSQPPAPAGGVSEKGATGSKSGKDSSSASKPAGAGEEAASTSKLRLGPLDPSVPPTNVPHDRPIIGLALGGGGALALSEIGVLQWFEEHHIPVDEIAGTSMGSIIGALYATGHTPDEMQHVLTDESVSSVFRITQPYTALSFRRREDEREVPNAITLGLRHGVSFRNSLLTDSGLNELLDREFLRYNDQTDFNDLPIPFRCQATDLNAAKTVTFARGSLQDAVRASASIPGVFRPFELNGHEYVDGAVLENLPTPDIQAMRADVILAVSLPLEPVGNGDLDSILGVLNRAFAVAIENNEAQERKLANVVLMPDVSGFASTDYLNTIPLAKRGYAVAEAHKAELMKYALSDREWQQYIAGRAARIHGPADTVLSVKVNAPRPDLKEIVEKRFAPLVNQPVDTKQIDALLASVRSDGRYDADYTVGYDAEQPDRPILLVTVSDKKTGPPFLDVGVNIAAQTGGVTRASVNFILLDQDLGGYGSELRTKVDVGFLTRVESEYYRKLGQTGFFVAPRAGISREPFYIYSGNERLSERLLQQGGPGADVGWSDGREQELRAGWQFQNVSWTVDTGADTLPTYSGNAQKARVQYTFDSEDRALVPEYGVRLRTDFGYLYATPNSPSAPQLFTELDGSRTFRKKNVILFKAEGATMFNRDVAQPFRYTLGGPLRLSASAIDQYRGTDYFLVTPGYLRRIRSLPAPLNTSLFVGGSYEIGQMRSPEAATITRQDAYFGVIAETPFGVISVGPAIGNGGERKLVFTIGRLF
jgi:NTE family protein